MTIRPLFLFLSHKTIARNEHCSIKLFLIKHTNVVFENINFMNESNGFFFKGNEQPESNNNKKRMPKDKEHSFKIFFFQNHEKKSGSLSKKKPNHTVAHAQQ